MNKDHTYYIKNRIKILQKAKEYRDLQKELMEKEYIKQKQYILKLYHLECNTRYRNEMKTDLLNVRVNFNVSFD